MAKLNLRESDSGYKSGDRYYGGLPAEPEYEGPSKRARYWEELIQYFKDTVREYPEYYVIGTSPVAVTLKTPDGKETIDLTKFDALADADEAIEMASHYFDESLFEARKKKKNGALVNPDAGNVEHNIEMFNKMNSPVDGPSNNPISGPFGGDVGAGEAVVESMNESTTKSLRYQFLDETYEYDELMDIIFSFRDTSDFVGKSKSALINFILDNWDMWDFQDEFESWTASLNESVVNEARDPYSTPYGYKDAAKVLNGKAPEYYYHLKEIEMDQGDGEKLARYARKIGLPVVQDPDDDPDYPTFYILGKYHWNDYFYPYPSNYEPKVEESLTEAAPKKETIELEYKNLKFTQYGPQRDVDDWDEWDRCVDWTYEVDKDDLYTFIFESCIDESDFPEAFEDEFDPNNAEHWARFESWLDDNFDAIYSKYEDKILESWEEEAAEQAAQEYDPDDYVDWDSMPGGYDYERDRRMELGESYKREPRMIDYFEQMNSEEDEA